MRQYADCRCVFSFWPPWPEARSRTDRRPVSSAASVTDASGGAAARCLRHHHGDRGEKIAITEEDGTYRFALLVPGSYVVKAALEGMGTAEETVQVTAGQRSEVDLELKARDRRGDHGHLRGADGRQVQRRRRRDHARARSASRSPARTAPSTASSTSCPASPTRTRTPTSRRRARTSTARPGPTRRSTSTASTPPSPATAAPASSCPPPATTEVSLESGGLGADYGRTVGSRTNVIVKSGTNNYHGDSVIYSRPRRSGTRETTTSRRSASASRTRSRPTSSSAPTLEKEDDDDQLRDVLRRSDQARQGLVLRLA